MVESAAVVIARAVRARRLELALTTEAAAAAARIQEKSWRVIEQGLTNPSRLMMTAVCRSLDWPPERFTSLLEREMHVNGNAERVVDLGALARADERAKPQAPRRRAVTALDATGLTPAQLADVQDYIDELRDSDSS